MYTFKKENSWRHHQNDFIARRQKKSLARKLAKLAAGVCVLTVLGSGGVLGVKWYRALDTASSPQPVKTQVVKPPVQLTLDDVRSLTGQARLVNFTQNHTFVDTPEESYTLKTALDIRLQEALQKRLAYLKTLTRGKPQRIAMVAMDPETGFIKAMAGFDLDDPNANPCLESNYPAASIFKIVTASAVVDSLGYDPHTPLYFNGQKYTLYKRQLTNTRNKYTRRVTLSQAFAESINPVFGKLGKNELGRERLDTYAQAFGFNQTLGADLKIHPSQFQVTESDYHLAELGSGFNRNTRISPLFGALMVSTIVNQGQAPVPRIVDNILTSDGTRVYKSSQAVYKSPIAPQTADTMVELMKRTITHGTAKKAFRGLSRDKVLSHLTIGGKTGSLSNVAHTVKYDWFTGFARDQKTDKSLVVSVVVGHREYIGTRASTHARAMMKTYFMPQEKKKAQNMVNKGTTDESNS